MLVVAFPYGLGKDEYILGIGSGRQERTVTNRMEVSDAKYRSLSF